MKRAAACSGMAGFLAANALELRANPLGLPIGAQVYPLRSMLKDFPAFAKTMAEIGVTRLDYVRRSVTAATSPRSRAGPKSGRSWPIMA